MRGFLSPLRFMSVSGRPNLEFWFTQVVILVSTVLGVYLAGFAGFEIAVNFDRYQSASEVSYLEKSLRAEVADNIAKVEFWAESYDQGPMLWHDSRFAPRESFKLDDMIWQTMRNSPRTFEVDPDVLTGVRRFYSKVDQYKTVLFQQRQPNALARNAMKELSAAGADARQTLLPILDSEIASHESLLQKFLPE
ncbi:hypothetical protein [Aestuariispira ectoiniformans]|uniref:hypothetical protein n=1 Tax=Aestuariispira ectoiniformans TaxID=2775080 RepID=UPI00223BDABE|nr:hypothetical protein [Aestuariispira ectoiniformans]